jgi:asparagine synthase (glutamine-hydrolysing)
MCQAMRHRGPDDEGLFVDGRVALGMRRLSIIDLAGGKQPISNEDGRITVVLNGEIYNYAELRAGLLARGHTLATHSDTETIVHLYEELGPRCVEQLRGMFAFALWDAREDRLLLARDRFGMKPLYVAEGPWGMAWASELKVLHGAGVPLGTLDADALDAYFQIGYIPAPRTPFTGVRKLMPAHVLTWTPHEGTRTTRYWALPTDTVAAPADAAEQVRAQLTDTVRAHLVADVPVAALLSGGLDSSAVVAAMAQAGQTPHAFTVRYLGSGAEAADESGLARLLADRYGARLTVLDVAPDVRDTFASIIEALDEPLADESAVPTWHISQAVAREYKVVLSGAGGDELFGGYRRHFGLLAGDRWRRLPAPMRRAVASAVSLAPDMGGLTMDRLKRFVRTGNGDAADQYAGMVTRLADGPRRRLLRDLHPSQPSTATTAFRAALPAMGGIRRALAMDYGTYLPDDILALSDRLSSAHSLEMRTPLVDHKLVDTVFRFDDATRIGNGTPKRLLREALAPWLPDAHFRAPKRGFVGPTAAWLRGELRPVLEEALAPERVKSVGFLNADLVTSFKHEHFTRRENREGILWAVLCFLTWHERYGRSAATGTAAW